MFGRKVGEKTTKEKTILVEEIVVVDVVE